MHHSRLLLAACVVLLAGLSASGCGSSSPKPTAPAAPQGYYPPAPGTLQPPIGNGNSGYQDNDDNYVPMNYNY